MKFINIKYHCVVLKQLFIYFKKRHKIKIFYVSNNPEFDCKLNKTCIVFGCDSIIKINKYILRFSIWNSTNRNSSSYCEYACICKLVFNWVEKMLFWAKLARIMFHSICDRICSVNIRVYTLPLERIPSSTNQTSNNYHWFKIEYTRIPFK